MSTVCAIEAISRPEHQLPGGTKESSHECFQKAVPEAIHSVLLPSTVHRDLTAFLKILAAACLFIATNFSLSRSQTVGSTWSGYETFRALHYNSASEICTCTYAIASPRWAMEGARAGTGASAIRIIVCAAVLTLGSSKVLHRRSEGEPNRTPHDESFIGYTRKGVLWRIESKH